MPRYKAVNVQWKLANGPIGNPGSRHGRLTRWGEVVVQAPASHPQTPLCYTSPLLVRPNRLINHKRVQLRRREGQNVHIDSEEVGELATRRPKNVHKKPTGLPPSRRMAPRCAAAQLGPSIGRYWVPALERPASCTTCRGLGGLVQRGGQQLLVRCGEPRAGHARGAARRRSACCSGPARAPLGCSGPARGTARAPLGRWGAARAPLGVAPLRSRRRHCLGAARSAARGPRQAGHPLRRKPKPELEPASGALPLAANALGPFPCKVCASATWAD